MLWMNTTLDYVVLSNNQIGAIHPNVELGIDVDDNFDLDKIRTFKKNLTEYLEKGLNDCLIKN